jgi:hypothetical protein
MEDFRRLSVTSAQKHRLLVSSRADTAFHSSDRHTKGPVMSIIVDCECGGRLKAQDEFAGKRGECPYCGRMLRVPAAESVEVERDPLMERGPRGDRKVAPKPKAARRDEPLDIADFFDPPAPRKRPQEKVEQPPVLRRMFEALLAPRSIHWMLTIGGGLCVLGLIIWLVSLGIFKDPRMTAVVLGIGSLAVLGGGWAVTLRTRFAVAGRALTFLGCVVVPLNLWFYHTQGLVTLDSGLWIGGLVCVGLYAATVFVLRDPLFMYAVEAGVTLTVLLLLGDMGRIADTGYLSLFLLALGFVSIHAERAFAPEHDVFSRRRFGLPLFWAGHAQLAVALVILLVSQFFGWWGELLAVQWPGNLLTESWLLAGGLWLAATYLYLYSDLVVRRIGVYVYIAPFTLLMAEATLFGSWLHAEGLIAALSLTALAANVAYRQLAAKNAMVNRTVPALGLAFSALPVFIGMALHFRATSAIAASADWGYATGWGFVAAMLVVAACNRVSALLFRHTEPHVSTTYFFFSAAGLIVAAAGLLRTLGLTGWLDQAPLLMAIPTAFLIASRLWRGHSPERPLHLVAHVSTAVILIAGIGTILGESFRPMLGATENLLLGLVFVEAAVFYLLAAMIRRRGWAIHLATAAGCGAVWQFAGYWGIESSWYTLVYAGLGAALLTIARVSGMETLETFDAEGSKSLAVRGRGAAAFDSGNAVLSVALVAAFLRSLAALAASRAGIAWLDLSSLLITTGIAFGAAVFVPLPGWRRWYVTAGVALAGVACLTFNVLIDLSPWQKLEIFSVAAGLLMLAASHAARFREPDDKDDDRVTTGLWFGSLLAVAPLFVAVMCNRYALGRISLYDELALLTVSVAMLVTGCSWRIKSTTLFGGGNLAVYLLVVIISVLYNPQVAVGVYLLIGGGLIFAAGIALSLYREKLLELPDRFAKREGLFRIINWR